MSLKRYDLVGWEEMDEEPTGEFVKLQDVIELLEPYSQCQSNDYCWPRCECIRSDFFLSLIKGGQK